MNPDPNVGDFNGDFYVVPEMCMRCGAPAAEANELIGWSTDALNCCFRRQPQNPQEVELAIRALRVQCCGAIRYRGSDSAVVEKIRAAGQADQCDAV